MFSVPGFLMGITIQKLVDEMSLFQEKKTTAKILSKKTQQANIIIRAVN
jgi:hypothetical protein